MYSSLPKREKTISIDIVGETTGEHFKDDFVVHTVLNMASRHALELEKSRLLGDSLNPTRMLSNISISLATVRHHIIKAPDWWTELGAGSLILDENVILDIYDKIVEAEREWRESIKKKAEDSKKEQEAEDKKEAESEGK